MIETAPAVNADDLGWQLHKRGGVPPRIVDALLERGWLDLVVTAAAERGDWFCAAGAVRGLCEAGEFERAWTVIEPFTASGWQPAVRTGADVLLGRGRVAEALDLARPRSRAPEAGEAWRDYAEVLVEAGRADEAIDVLVPRLGEGETLAALVEMTEGQGRDDRLLDLPGPLVHEARQAEAEGRRYGPWAALSAQARVLERCGRTDEAIAALAEDIPARRFGSHTTLEFYAQLLARHGRTKALRDLADTHEREALRPYVTALEAAGRAGEAEAYLRERAATEQYPTFCESLLLELLVRQGRPDEAVDAVRHTFDDLHSTCLLQPAMLLLAEHGHPDRAVALTEGRSPEFIEANNYWLPSNRWRLMGQAGRCQEAIDEIRALPADEVDDRDLTIARMIAQDGRVDEAIALLREIPGREAATDLAALLIRQGHCDEAIAVIPGVAAQREEDRRFWDAWKQRSQAAENEGGCTEEPPF